MKAAAFLAAGAPLDVIDLPGPVAGVGQVLLKICRCGICGSDLHMTEQPDVFKITPGMVLGHEFSGEVLEAGRDVTGLKPGDQVAVSPVAGCGHCAACQRGETAWCTTHFHLLGGGYAQYTAVPAHQCRRLPADVSAADGALAEPMAVALHGILRAGLKRGDRVMVVGAGAIGLAVAFWARRLGAAEVGISDLERWQEERAMALGASAFFVAGDGLAQQVAGRLNGAPDIVFECVGKPGLIDHCVELVRPRGTVLVLGLCTRPDYIDSFRALSKEVDIKMSAFFTMHEFQGAIDALDRGRYSPMDLISETVSLGAMPATFEALRHRTTQCKVLLDPHLP